MSIVAPTAPLTVPGKRDLPKVSSWLIKGVFSCSFWGLGSGGVISVLPVKPFETVMVIKDYTNKWKRNG